jgi:hypothetical protein
MKDDSDIEETPLKIGETVTLRAWDNSARSYVFLTGEITRRIDEPGKLSMYSVRVGQVIYHRLKRQLMTHKVQLFGG